MSPLFPIPLLSWPLLAQAIVPIVTALDKVRVGEYISEGQRKGIDLSACDFKHVDRSNPTMLQASIQTILEEGLSSQMVAGQEIPCVYYRWCV